jgi:3'(2'), 5'-bisphosphate nucleotidase
MPYERELQTALAAAELAGRALMDIYTRFATIADAPADIHLDADRQSQEIILAHVRGVFPQDALCAEEETPTLAGAAHTGARLWVVDPIDGTRGFARKMGEFSVMIAFVDGGMPAVGVVLEPAQGRLTYAVRDGGCWKRDGGVAAPCRVTATTTLAAAVLTQSRSSDPQPVQLVKPARVVETYSAGIKLALVARGEAALYVNTYRKFSDWDTCAGHILVDEAGGRVTGLAGQELRYGLPGARQEHGVLATNGPLHEAALAALRPIAF